MSWSRMRVCKSTAHVVKTVRGTITTRMNVKNVLRRSWDALTRSCRNVRRASTLVLAGVLLVGQGAHANFVNGDFETGAFSPAWTVSSYLNNSGLSVVPPTQVSHLNLTAAGANGLSGVTTGAGTDANTGNAVSYPRWGSHAARVNNASANYNTSAIAQTVTMVGSDVAADGNIHVRFALAPVLENPSHANNEQPYFYVQLTNVTKNTVVFTQFNFANQPGVAWQTFGGIQYTDWNTYDVPLAPGVVDVGDQVKVEIFAAGCSLGGHWGYVYVDQVSTAPFPSLAVTTIGPATTAPGSQITYTYTYTNNTGGATNNTIVDAVLPVTGNSLNTTFVSYSAGGAVCTAPAVGATGTVSCNFGTLADGASGTFQITVTVPPGASIVSPTNVVNNGNYKVKADGNPALAGPLFVSNVTPVTDLAITVSDGATSVLPGAAVTYTVTVSNTGTNVTGAPVSQSVEGLTNVQWTCAASVGSSCGAASGTGVIADAGNILTGGTLTYTVTATAGPSGTTGTTVNVAVPAGVTDTNLTNNSASDTNTILTLYPLTLGKAGSGVGTVTSAPTGINCDAACSSASTQVVDGNTVTLTAVAPAGTVFSGWTGACTGTATCTVTIAGAAANVTAIFDKQYTVTPSIIGANGSVTPPTSSLVTQGSSMVYTFTPAAGFVPLVRGTCAGTLSGNTYTTAAVTADCTVIVTFLSTLPVPTLSEWSLLLMSVLLGLLALRGLPANRRRD